jgi:hypothetical protein
MAFLYECGHCGAFYQTKVTLLSTSKHKLLCSNCGKHNIFGEPPADATHEPVIEQVAPDKLRDFIPSNYSIPVVDIFWECGTCSSKYQFNSTSISEHGSKITCQTCFNFVVLRQIGPMHDLEFIRAQDISQPTARDIVQTLDEEIEPESPAERRFDEASKIGQHERIDQATDHSIEKFISHPEDEASHTPVIRSNYADPRKNQRDVVFPASSAKKDPPQETPYEPTEDKPKPPQDLTPAGQQPQSYESEPINQPLPPSEHVAPPPPEVKPDPEEVARLQEAYAGPDQSFMAYQQFKQNETFSYSIQAHEIRDVDPEASMPKVVKAVEKNMIKFSLILSGILIVLLTGFMFYKQNKEEKRAEQQRIEAQKRLEEIENNASQSQYGFPEIPEAPDAEQTP